MSTLLEKWDKVQDVLRNVSDPRSSNVSFVVEHADWIIRRIGETVARELNAGGRQRVRVTTTHLGLRNQTVHFGSINTFYKNGRLQWPHESNRVVLTWFHIREGDEACGRVMAREAERIGAIHTACSSTRDQLVGFGLPAEKIHIIPLGIDVNLFHPGSPQERAVLRQELDIPADAWVVGSFQKDGQGWADGLEPKLIKGPDLFVAACKDANRERPLMVLLVGPARGYVENGLRMAGIPYRSTGRLGRFEDVARFYHALDAYAITSRVEGGPQQILEAWASGVPVVASRVGLIPDIAVDGTSALLTDVESVDQTVQAMLRLRDDPALRERLIANGLQRAPEFGWPAIAARYDEVLYR